MRYLVSGLLSLLSAAQRDGLAFAALGDRLLAVDQPPSPRSFDCVTATPPLQSFHFAPLNTSGESAI